MEYLAPVINHVHNKLNTHLTLKINYVRYSIPAKDITKLEFDVMSRASGTECTDLCNAIKNGYITVDVLILKDGEYTKVGEYEISDCHKTPVIKPVIANPKKAEDTAKDLGITVIQNEAKKESCNKVEPESKPALDPIKAINNPKARKLSDNTAKKAEVKEEPKTALDAVKENIDKDK